MNENRRVVCWQGWKLEIPRRWDPVKLEGDHTEGYALFADTLRPRLGLRWQTAKKGISPFFAGTKKMGTAPYSATEKATEKTGPVPVFSVNKMAVAPIFAVVAAMKNEVGQLAASEAKEVRCEDATWQSPLLYVEPDPPGRDVFSVYSQVSNRLLQVAYHAHRREHILASTILPTLHDVPLDRAAPWSIFDLNCVIPAGMKLKSHRLNAGDLGLTFADRFNEVTIRQIAVAQVALQRQPLEAWIADQQKTTGRYHVPTGIFVDTSVAELPARSTRSIKRLRYALLTGKPRTYFTVGLHDPTRDRLILLHGSDESLLRVIGESVGAIK